MPRPPRNFDPNAAYHIYARGVRSQDIFVCPEDCDFFLNKVEKNLPEFGVRFLSYSLMPNHFHFELIDPAEELSRFMHRLLTSCSVYFNHRYKKTGHLFERRFNSKVCRSDRYALALARYIDMNPVRAGFVNHPQEWPWSGWSELFGLNSRRILSLEDRERIVGDSGGYRTFVEEGVRRSVHSARDRMPAPTMIGPRGSHVDPVRLKLERLARERTNLDGITIEDLRRKRFRYLTGSRIAFVRKAETEGISRKAMASYLNCSKAAVQRLLKLPLGLTPELEGDAAAEALA